MRKQDGFVILDALLALAIVSIGLLALASSAAAIARLIGQGLRHTRAATLAMSRSETLLSSGCSGMTGGVDTVGAFIVSWSVASMSAGRGRLVTVTVASPSGRGIHTDSFTTASSCQ